MTGTRAWATVVLAAAALAGCKETVSSCDIRTGGLAELTTVTSENGSTSTVHTNLVVGGDESNTYANLDCGDRIYAQVNGTDRQDMRSVADGEFEAEFDTAAEDDDFNVILERGQDESTDESHGTMPAPFDITSTFDATEHSRATEAITIAWEPSATTDRMEVDADGTCIFHWGTTVGGDPGTLDIPAGDLDSTNDDDPQTCNVTVTVRRERDGVNDSAFDAESWFLLQQVRSVEFVSAP